ncbi:MAG TPA: hypothetical protein VHC69_12930 [Polyangiaceae bacterium]|nr:hypothetical protein [Polyangiaceae bacterium]
MNVQRQIARLESLLSRIQRNASKPRGVVTAATPAVVAAPSLADAAPDSGPPTDRAELRSEPPAAMPEAAAAPVEAAVEVVELEMSDDEIVEIATDVAVEEFAAAESPSAGRAEATADEERAAPLANELAEEPAPESAPRPAAQIGEEADLEPPVKTPPPESGRQIVASPVGVAGEAEFQETSAVASFEPDLSASAISQAPANEPSAAQLGETVELEGSGEPPARIELLSAPIGIPEPSAEIPADELELSLPQQQYGGGYDRDLAPPSRAAEDLARHREQAERAQHPPTQPPISLGAPPSTDFAEPGAANVAIISPPVAGGPTSPVVVSRPALPDVQVAEMRTPSPAELPSTFLQLLDASLSIEA